MNFSSVFKGLIAAGIFACSLIVLNDGAEACTTPDGCPWQTCPQSGGYWFVSLKKCVPAGFNGTHRQISSNAGACPNCTLRVATNPRSNAFVVKASNGWKAYMRYNDDKHSSARGSGKWPANFGVYANKPFMISLTKKTIKRGNPNRFQTEMRIKTEGVPGEVVATFQGAFKRPTFRDLGIRP